MEKQSNRDPPTPIRKVAYDGGPNAKLRIVWARAENGCYPGEEFFLTQCSEDQRSKFMATFRMVAEAGHVRQEKLYRYPLEGCGNLGEFKTFKKRLFFYRSGNDLVITCGATKKDDRTKRTDLDRVETIKQQVERQELAVQGITRRGGSPKGWGGKDE